MEMLIFLSDRRLAGGQLVRVPIIIFSHLFFFIIVALSTIVKKANSKYTFL